MMSLHGVFVESCTILKGRDKFVEAGCRRVCGGQTAAALESKEWERGRMCLQRSMHGSIDRYGAIRALPLWEYAGRATGRRGGRISEESPGKREILWMERETYRQGTTLRKLSLVQIA